MKVLNVRRLLQSLHSVKVRKYDSVLPQRQNIYFTSGNICLTGVHVKTGVNFVNEPGDFQFKFHGLEMCAPH